MSTPRVISIDSEAYGKVKTLPDGRPSPHQQTFHPRRMIYTDGAQLRDLVLTTNITIPQEDPRWAQPAGLPSPIPSEELRTSVAHPAPTSGSHPSPTSTRNTDTTPPHLSPASILSPTSARLSETPLGLIPTPPSSWTGSLLEKLKPGPSFVARMHLPDQRDLVRRWLAHADTLIGTNLQYDLMVLRTDPRLRPILDGKRHFLIDLTVLSYLHSEVRESHSLKNLGHSLGTHSYDETPDEGETYKRYKDVNDPGLLQYAAQDSHNTMVDVAEMCRRIIRDYPGTHKLSAFCLRFYSDTIWTCVRMSEAGVPMDARRLLRLERHLEARVARCVALAAGHGLVLQGEGSDKSKQSFVTRLIQEIDSCNPTPASVPYATGLQPSSVSSSGSSLVGVSASLPSVLDHPALVKTPKKKQVSFSIENRQLFLSLLPVRHPLRGPLGLAQTHSQLSKLVNTYTYPLLHHKRDHPTDQRSKLVPRFNMWGSLPSSSGISLCSCSQCSAERASSALSGAPSGSPSAAPAYGINGSRTTNDWRGDIQFSYPTWFVTPGFTKDESGARGGTKQGRITAKNHAHQTDPPIIQSCIRSRFGPSGCIIKSDASQIELRVPALLTGEPFLLSEYQKPDPDLHTKMAVQIFGVPFLTEKYGGGWARHPVFRKSTTGERQIGKHVNFGNVYRASAETMHSTVLEMSGTNLPMSIFTNIEQSRPTIMPILWAWQEYLLDTAEKYGHIEIPLIGQSRRFDNFSRKRRRSGEDPVKNMANEIVNCPIQTIAGDVMLAVQHELHRTLPSINDDRCPCYMFLNIYDAMFFDCLRSYLPTLRSLIDSAIHRVSTTGLWGQLSRLTGYTVPLVFELSEHH